MITITIEVEPEVATLLETLTGGITGCKDIGEVVSHLTHAAADGVRRPGAWERGWVTQAFGDEFEAKLESDPTAPSWRRRPRSK